jgi:hypothetical protein
LTVLCLAWPATASPPEPPAVKVEISAGAKKLLEKNKASLDGGILRKRGQKEGYDLAHGSGSLVAVVHPNDPSALAVALYDDGWRYAELNVTFESFGPALSPLSGVDEETLRKLFPGKSAAEMPAAPELDLSAGDLMDCVLTRVRRIRQEEESDPCRGRAGCGSAVVLEDLRRRYIVHLSSVPGDGVGMTAAEFLRTSSIAFSFVDLEEALATYDSIRDAVEFPERLFAPLWAGIKDSRLGPEAEDVVERTAPALAHELRHARMLHELGFNEPGFAETESLAYADLALFLWARLERDPDYEGMGTFNRLLMSTAGFAAPSARWWREPVRASDLERLRAYTPSAKRLMGDAVMENTSNDWFLARSLAGGLAGLDANLERAQGLGLSAFQATGDFLARRAEDADRSIAAMESCLRLERDPSGRRAFEDQIRLLKERRRFYTEPGLFQRLLDYYRRERALQQAEIDRRQRD